MLGVLLLSPFSGLSFVLREIAQAVGMTRATPTAARPWPRCRSCTG